MARRTAKQQQQMDDMTMQVEWLTAKDAHAILAGNTVNRRTSQWQVTKLARDMLEGRWGPNPQPIMLSPTGRLIDGQHRLLALLMASETRPDITVPFMVARGVPEAAFDVVDQGNPRTAAHTLGIHGVLNATQVASAARTVIRYERFPDKVWSGAADASKAEVIAFCLKHQDELAMLDGWKNLRTVNLNGSSWVALNWLVLRHSAKPDHWDLFKDGVIVGAGLHVGDARLTLRNRGKLLMSDWGGGQGRLGVYIKAWNAWVQGKEARTLRFLRNEMPMPVVL